MNLEQVALPAMIILIQMTLLLTASKIFATIRLSILIQTDLASSVTHSSIQILKVLLAHIEAAHKKHAKMVPITLIS
jgi:hypothetical protein